MNFYKGELKNFDLCKIQKYIGENISLAICKNDKSIKLENNKEDLLNLLKENKKLYICLGSAVHGNLGDQALGLCRVEFLKYCGISNSDIIEYTTRDKMRYWLQICRETKESDIIVLRGGGYWGDLWIDGFE